MTRTLTALFMAVGITGPFASHLGAENNREVAYVPFAFVASNTNMPAGRYTVEQKPNDSPIFTLTDGSRHSIFVMLNKKENGNPDHASLTFACYGTDCELTKITPPNSASAYALRQHSVEKKAPRKLGIAAMVSINLGN